MKVRIYVNTANIKEKNEKEFILTVLHVVGESLNNHLDNLFVSSISLKVSTYNYLFCISDDESYKENYYISKV